MRQPLIDVQAPCAATRETSPLSAEQAWPLILQLAERARRGAPLRHTTGFAYVEGRFTTVDTTENAPIVIDPIALSVHFAPTMPASSDARNLCAPACAG